LLKQRLATLEYAGIVTHSRADGGANYELTPAGEALKPIVRSIGEWGQRWARDIEACDLDPGWLVWSMHRRLNVEAMPPGRTVIEIEFIDAPAATRRFWLVHCDGVVDVCVKDPGFDPTVRMSTRVRTLAEVWRGLRSLRSEVRAGTVTVQGPAQYRRELPQWLLLSAYADITRPQSKA
jgi:HxlR-like helix-turn-helix